MDSLLDPSKRRGRPTCGAVALLVAFFTLMSGAVQAASYTYSNTTSAAIPEYNGSNTCGTLVVRNITVTDTFTVADLNVGIVIDHPQKDDLAIVLQSPGGDMNKFIVFGAGGTTADFNVRLDDESATALGAELHDADASYPQFVRRPQLTLSDADGLQANGTWRLIVCDNQPGNTGTIRGAHLEFTIGQPATDPLVVTSTGDTDTPGTLRHAIAAANAGAGADTISFDIPGAGPHTVTLGSQLPAITDPGTTIDGTTQAGASCGSVATGTPHALKIQITTGNTAGVDVFSSSASGTTIRGLAFHDIDLSPIVLQGGSGTIECNNIGVRADNTTAGPTGGMTSNSPVSVNSSAVATIVNNLVANNRRHGVYAGGGYGTTVRGNLIRDNAADGVSLSQSAETAAIYANSIHSNGGNGIDLNNDDVTGNDAGDGDPGPNDLLNFPIIDGFDADGTTSVSYAVTLDVPAHGAGYRLDFFRNAVFESHGEGEVHLGSVDVSGPGSHAGGFTADAPVSPNDFVSATTTRIVGGTTYDITSEFGPTVTATAAAAAGGNPLIVTSTGDANTPGTLRHAINQANANPGDDLITFAIPGAGPHLLRPASDLPVIADDGVTIDASGQSGAACNAVNRGMPHALKVEIRRAAGSHTGLSVTGDTVTIRGLSITNFPREGVIVSASASGFTLDCTYVGIRPDGTPDANTKNDNHTSAVLIGGSGARVTDNVISANDNDADDAGVTVENASGALLTGNVIGLLPDGLTAAGNGGVGIAMIGASSSTIGGTTVAARNVVASNDNTGIYIRNSNAIQVYGNYSGIAADGVTDRGNTFDGLLADASTAITVGSASGGGNVMSGNGSDGIEFFNGSTGSAVGNTVGLNAAGTGIVANAATGISVDGSGSVATIGDGSAGGRNHIGGNASHGIFLYDGGRATVTGNHVGVGTDGSAQGQAFGIAVASGAGGSASGNLIAHSASSGIVTDSTASDFAIYANSIHSNGGPGIDLHDDGVTGNDAGDGDGGSNDLLNFPRIDGFTASGTTTVGYGIVLDVPAHAAGYRVDFFRNTVSETHGEGEIHLGFVEGLAPGSHAGILAANAAVSVGDVISATTTRIVSGISYDITSEFSASVAATGGADPMVVTSAADSGAGTLRAAIEHANANPGADAITFAIPGAASAVHVVTLASALPDITDAGVSIDGTTQGDAQCGDLWAGTPHRLRVQVDGGGRGFPGLGTVATGTAFTGLSVTNAERGIRFLAGAHGGTVHCSYLGLAPDGTAAGNATNGVDTAAVGVRVGGAAAGQGNAIGGNRWGVITHPGSSGTMIRGNFIGTDPTGTAPRPNASQGIAQSAGTTTLSDITGNLISGNGFSGILYDSNDSITGSSGDVKIAGNFIGTNRTGTAPLPNGIGIAFTGNAISGVTIGGTAPADRNVVSGNTSLGLRLEALSGVTILGNHVGLGVDGTTVVANGNHGIQADDVTALAIGNGAASGRNVVSGNGNMGILIRGTSPGAAILGNRIGTDASGTAPRGNGNEGIRIGGTGTTGVRIEDTVIGDARPTADGTGIGVIVEDGATATLLRNRIGVGADGVTAMGNHRYGVAVLTGGRAVLGDGGAANGNAILNNGNNGLLVSDPTSRAASVGTTYGNNTGDAIRLSGAVGNDTGDGDAGPNDLLNHPAIDGFTVDGSSTVSYAVTLDVPAHGDGYRVEFFTSASPDPTSGEGQTFLGGIDAPGAGTHTGSFTATTPVPVGASISATTTRRTGSGFDITSEFSVNARSRTANPADLVAVKSVQVIDDGLIGGDDTVAIPGSTLRYTIVIRNDGAGAADAGSTVVADQIPPNGSFKVSDFGGMPGTGPLGVTQGSPSSGLTYSYTGLASGTDDLEFSSDGGASWTYAPADGGDGTDPSVTHIRVRPDGSFDARGGTAPSIEMRYDVVLF